MIKKLNEDTSLKFKNISPEEKSKKGILGRLYGPVASFAAPTRNGRHYSQDLWEKLFNSDLIKERFKNGGIFGQLNHPDYEEVDMEKIAVVMPEPPVKNDKGQLVAYVDILDTPCGRVAYQLAKYGYKFGISSRGTGDIIEDFSGNEEVDPDTYQLNAFDLVEIPAVESARLAFVESLDTKKLYGKTLKQKLSEELDNASEEDRKIMIETLDDLSINIDEELKDEDGWGETIRHELEPTFGRIEELMYEIRNARRDSFAGFGDRVSDLVRELDSIADELNIEANEIDYNQDKLIEDAKLNIEDETVAEDCSDKKEVAEVKEDAGDTGEDLMNELQEALTKSAQLEKDNLSLQEQLSVCNAKEVKVEEELNRYKSAIARLSDVSKEIKPLKEEVENLKTSLNEKDKLLESNSARLSLLVSTKKQNLMKIEESENKISDLENQIKVLNEQLSNKDKKLSDITLIAKKYKNALTESKENYIKVKADACGIPLKDIKAKLKESYSFKDIDSVCAELVEDKKNLSKLPFRLNEGATLNFKSSDKEYIRGINQFLGDDDHISETLLSMID